MVLQDWLAWFGVIEPKDTCIRIGPMIENHTRRFFCCASMTSLNVGIIESLVMRNDLEIKRISDRVIGC